MTKSLKTLALAGTAAFSLATAADAATHQRVVFESAGERLVGDLYLPDDYEAGDTLPAIVVTGAWTTVKEQMPARYASEMADRGYAALAFDFRGWGQSEGGVRQLEDPERKTQDIVAAARFLATRAEVDPRRMGGLGICASAGYMTDAVARSPQLGSLALVAPWMHDADIVETVYGGPESVQRLIETGRAAAASGEPRMIEAASSTNEDALMYQAPYYVDAARGAIPEYVNRFNLASWEPWLTYDAVRLADDISGTPVTIVHSEAAAIPQGARAFFERIDGPKSELWLDGVTQMDFYDAAEPVRISADRVVAHFADTLNAEAN
ncbi:MAG: alpha/beta hydrolase [Pseudomonadota bacterium]